MSVCKCLRKPSVLLKPSPCLQKPSFPREPSRVREPSKQCVAVVLLVLAWLG